jgi:hypothetical protein
MVIDGPLANVVGFKVIGEADWKGAKLTLPGKCRAFMHLEILVFYTAFIFSYARSGDFIPPFIHSRSH